MLDKPAACVARGIRWCYACVAHRISALTFIVIDRRKVARLCRLIVKRRKGCGQAARGRGARKSDTADLNGSKAGCFTLAKQNHGLASEERVADLLIM